MSKSKNTTPTPMTPSAAARIQSAAAKASGGQVAKESVNGGSLNRLIEQKI